MEYVLAQDMHLNPKNNRTTYDGGCHDFFRNFIGFFYGCDRDSGVGILSNPQ